MKTTKQTAQKTLAKVNSDISFYNKRAEEAVSTFRKTANTLAAVNVGLAQTATDVDALIRSLTEHKNAVHLKIKDNTAVHAKITEIIGK